MNTSAENIIEEPEANTLEIGNDKNVASDKVEDQEEQNSRASSEFAHKLVNAVKSLNNGEITHYEMVNLFNTAEESLYQVKLTCERLELTSGFIAGQESYVPRLIKHCDILRKKFPKKPFFLIVDSLQTLNDGKYGEDHTNSQSAVRALQALTDYAKEHYINAVSYTHLTLPTKA